MSSAASFSVEDFSPWFCVYTKPRQEGYASMHLRRQGLQTFLPLLKSRRSVRRRMCWVAAPLFPRYLFARIGNADVLSRIRSTLGVASLVSFGGNPAHVPEEIITLIRDRCEDDVLMADESGFQRGDAVSIVGGPYAGMNAIFDRSTSCEERVVILLEIMATVAKITIDRGFLRLQAC